MIGVENVEGEHRLWSLERCRVPLYTQELTILLNPLSILGTRAKLHVDEVNSVDVNHKDGLSIGVR